MRRPSAAFAVVFCFAGCASISKKYESEVRFERCYALDWKQDVDASIRSRCWEDWLVYYSEGQSRDRIEYAKNQTTGGALLSTAEPVASAASPPATAAPLPEPTSVFSPVPMMATPGGSASASVTSSGPALTRTPCEGKCDKALESCLSGCGSAVCEQYCAQRHGKCTGRCTGVKPPN
ncbi:MAG: hypothetical protein IPM79_08795 [Polyangiaceae bacterium]|nr:hypothetical protein [Polyangiaceae bacterium]